MTTITAKEFHTAGCTHTGPVYFDHGARPYSAAANGKLLKNKVGIVLEYKTAVAAARGIEKAAK